MNSNHAKCYEIRSIGTEFSDFYSVIIVRKDGASPRARVAKIVMKNEWNPDRYRHSCNTRILIKTSRILAKQSNCITVIGTHFLGAIIVLMSAVSSSSLRRLESHYYCYISFHCDYRTCWIKPIGAGGSRIRPFTEPRVKRYLPSSGATRAKTLGGSSLTK